MYFWRIFYVLSECSNQCFQSEGIPFFVFELQEYVVKFSKQICLFLDFWWIVLNDRHEIVDESDDLWRFWGYLEYKWLQRDWNLKQLSSLNELSTNWSVCLNGWVLFYELIGRVSQSRCSSLNLRYRPFFEQVPLHSGNFIDVIVDLQCGFTVNIDVTW